MGAMFLGSGDLMSADGNAVGVSVTDDAELDTVEVTVSIDAERVGLTPGAGRQVLSALVAGRHVGVCVNGEGAPASAPWLHVAAAGPGTLAVTMRSQGIVVVEAKGVDREAFTKALKRCVDHATVVEEVNAWRVTATPLVAASGRNVSLEVGGSNRVMIRFGGARKVALDLNDAQDFLGALERSSESGSEIRALSSDFARRVVLRVRCNTDRVTLEIPQEGGGSELEVVELLSLMGSVGACIAEIKRREWAQTVERRPWRVEARGMPGARRKQRGGQRVPVSVEPLGAEDEERIVQIGPVKIIVSEATAYALWSALDDSEAADDAGPDDVAASVDLGGRSSVHELIDRLIAELWAIKHQPTDVRVREWSRMMPVSTSVLGAAREEDLERLVATAGSQARAARLLGMSESRMSELRRGGSRRT